VSCRGLQEKEREGFEQGRPVCGNGRGPQQSNKTFYGVQIIKEGTVRGLLGRGFLKINVGFETDGSGWVEFLQLLRLEIVASS
jgi:hypothetical protein